MIDPETARQAWESWQRLWGPDTGVPSWHELQQAGDALAVLVPQLLDQLAEYEKDAHRALAMMQDGDRARDALESEKAQLLDQLADREEQLRLANIDACHEAVERDALGERCHQLETALNEIAERDSVVLMGRSRFGVLGKVARAALGDTPCEECGGVTNFGGLMVHAVGCLRGDAAAPPPPEKLRYEHPIEALHVRLASVTAQRDVARARVAELEGFSVEVDRINKTCAAVARLYAPGDGESAAWAVHSLLLDGEKKQ